ncbi:hypothetical protein M011DRAFT_379072, partial [Sporormia fimetaria CBS 119925]
RKWGFTIYRIAYGPGSDQHWQTVLDKIHTQISEDTVGCHPADAAAQQVLELFHLDARSDPALDGLDQSQLRQLYKDAVGGQPMGADDPIRRVFLLVDDEVMESVSRKDFFIKCVEVDYDPAKYKPHPR